MRAGHKGWWPSCQSENAGGRRCAGRSDARGIPEPDHGERIGQADVLGDVGLKVMLENQVADETRHMEEIERVLVGWEVRSE